MDLRIAILAAAPDAPDPAIEGMIEAHERLKKLGDNIASEQRETFKMRVSHLIGQCAHESVRFTHDAENLFYSTASRIRAVWPSRFKSNKAAEPFARNPEKLANKVYGGRMGNTAAGDGFKYRGRGYIQLTGKDNYRTYGEVIGVDLVSNPDRATEPDIAWLLAAAYMHLRKRSGKTVFRWAEENNVEQVTRAINGGTHGLADRRTRTFRALAAFGEVEPNPLLERGSSGVAVVLLQRALSGIGLSTGGQDGMFGPATEKALKVFQQSEGLAATGKTDDETWAALNVAGNNSQRLAAETTKPVQRAPAPIPTPALAPTNAPMPVTKPVPQAEAQRAAAGHAPQTAPLPPTKPRATETLAPESAPVPVARPQTKPVLPTLQQGMAGEEIALLQLCLIRKGYDVNARFGPSTEQAVRAFQADSLLKVDGIVGPNTWGKLDPPLI